MKNELITSRPDYYKDPWGCSNSEYNYIFKPIVALDSSSNSKEYDYNEELTTRLLGFDKNKKSAQSIPVIQLISKLGFYFDIDGYEQIRAEHPTLLPFEDNYVLVAEPLFWFENDFKLRKGFYSREAGNSLSNYSAFEFFYGTPTEWAIYDQMVSDRYHVNLEGGVHGYGIHPVMGELTYRAAPMCCVQLKDVTLRDEDEIYYKIEKVNRDDYIKKVNYVRDSCGSRKSFDGADIEIIERMGFAVMTKTQIAQISLTIDINKTNTTFRPDTDAVVSFKISQSEEYSHKFCPSYDDVGTEGAFGIKLTLTTFSFRDDNGANVPIPPEFAEPIEILCDGLPAQAAKTLAYKTVHMPEQTGTWRFELTVETNEPSVVSDGEKELSFTHKAEFFTNTSADGEKKTAKKFTYEITIQDPTEQYLTPPDTTANDGAAGFEIPDAYESMYTASSPVTELSWKYLRAVQKKDNPNDLTVDFVEVSDSAKASMDRQYLPCSYGNIPSAKSAENSADGLLHTRSGYGIGIKYSMLASKGYFQNGFVLYPEFDYDGYADKLENTRSGAYVNYMLAQNEYSMYKNTASSDYSRVHFTPVWYPDGDYNIIVYMYDCWTPVGMLWDSAVFTIKLSGSVYDDWYITRR